MNRVSLPLIIAAAVLGTTACSTERILLEEGTSSTLAVRVYVDANGNGTYDAAGDVPIASVTVTVDGQDAQFSETTDASGLASFQVPPGSYELGVSDGAPAGAVLSTSSTPTVVATFQGGNLSAEFRYAFMPGGIAGVIFRDDDGSGTFDPAQDTPAAGIQIALFAGATAAGDPAASATTDVGGAFQFDALRPGTYTLEFTPFPTIEIVGGNTQNVTVGAESATDVAIEFTGSLLVSVADARNAADGDPIAVEGVVTWQAQWDSRQYFLQDPSAGIAVFDAAGTTLTVGDSVRVIGEKDTFRGEVQITNVSSVLVIENVGEPNPTVVTALQINAGAFQGRLVTLDATVDSLTTDGFDNQTVYLTDAAGQTFLVYSDSRTGVLPAAWAVGEPFSVTGVLGADDRSDRFPLPYRIEVRSPADVVQGVSTISIADARLLDGQTVTVEGVVTWQNQWDSRVYFFQDETAGISVFDGSEPTLQEGDRIRVKGTIGAFRGEVQISPTEAPAVIAQEAVPLPTFVTAAQINAGQFQGQLVTITATVDTVSVGSFDNQTVFLSDGAGETFVVYGDSRTGVASSAWTVGANVDVAGVLGTDDRNTLPHRIEIRRLEDLTTAVPTVTLAAARMMDGQTVTVEGVVTWQAQWDDRVYFFQDETGGITTFDGNSPMLEIGYRIRMTGTIGAFRGEVQISPSEAPTVIGQQAVPTPRAVTAAEINAGSFQGELVSITATVDSLTVDGFDNQTVYLTNGAAETLLVYGDSRNGAGSDAWTVGVPHAVVGVLGTDDRSDRFPLPHRIEVRGPDDIQFGGSTISIAAARGMDGATVVVEGWVTWQTQWDSRVFFFQDVTGGLSSFYSSAPTLARGDRIRILGDIGAFRGEVQISPSALKIVAQEFEPAARTVTAAEINAGMFQGEVVSLTGTVDSLTADTFDNQTVFLTDDGGETFLVYGDSRTGVVSASWTVGASVKVTGVLGTDDRFAPLHRIEVRDPSDLQGL